MRYRAELSLEEAVRPTSDPVRPLRVAGVESGHSPLVRSVTPLDVSRRGVLSPIRPESEFHPPAGVEGNHGLSCDSFL
jgi:hypothetical protein